MQKQLSPTAAEVEAAEVKRMVLDQARAVANYPPNVRHAQITPLIGWARSTGLDIENEIFAAADCTPEEYWCWKLDSGPTRLEALVLLLSQHVSGPGEGFMWRGGAVMDDEGVWQPGPEGPGPVTDNEGTVTQWRVRAALRLAIAAGSLETFEHNGKQWLRDPRAAVEMLLHSPMNENLVPRSLAAFLKPPVKTPRSSSRVHQPKLDRFMESWAQTHKPTYRAFYRAARDEFKDRVTDKMVRATLKAWKQKPVATCGKKSAPQSNQRKY